MIVLLLLGIVLINAWKKNNVEYTRAELVQDLEDGDIEEVVIHPNAQGPTGYLDVTFASGQEKTLYATDISELEKLVRGNGIEPRVLDIQRESIFLTSILPTLIIVVAAAFFFIMMNAQNAGGGSSARMMNFGKSRAKLANVGDDKVTLKDVAGLREEKEELEEIVEFLKNPKKFTDMGARIPKGVLLVGQPGTGKTLIAKAIAGEAGVPFISMSGSEFIEMFAGLGASRVRKLFEKANSNDENLQ